MVDQALPVRGRQLAERVEGHALVVVRVAHVQPGELIGAEHVDVLGDVLHPGITGVREADLSRLAALGRHDDDAIGRAGTVDRGGRGVLQHVDRFDVARTDLIQIRADHAIDHHEGIVRPLDRIAAAHAQAHHRAGLRVRRLDLHAGHEPRNRLVDPRHRDGLDVFARDRANRARQVRLALRAVAHGHHWVQLDGARLQPEVGDGALGGLHHHGRVARGIAQQPRPQVVPPGRHGGNRIAALDVGFGYESRPDHADADARHRDPRIAGPHHACDRARGVLSRSAPRGREPRGAAEQTDTHRSHAHTLRRSWSRTRGTSVDATGAACAR